VLEDPKAITVDGVKGTEMDVTATVDAPTVYCKDPCVAVWPLGDGKPAGFTPGFVSRLVVLRLQGETVEIALYAPKAGLEALAKDFDAMIQTLQIG
jgi:hypothetical protein